LKEDLVSVFKGSLLEAQLLKDRLGEADVEAFVDQDDSPLDGLTAGDQFVIVRVHPDNAGKATAIAENFKSESSE